MRYLSKLLCMPSFCCTDAGVISMDRGGGGKDGCSNNDEKLMLWLTVQDIEFVAHKTCEGKFELDNDSCSLCTEAGGGSTGCDGGCDKDNGKDEAAPACQSASRDEDGGGWSTKAQKQLNTCNAKDRYNVAMVLESPWKVMRNMTKT